MYDSGYYPPGAYNDPNAPYNQPADPDPMEFDVAVTQSLSKDTTVWSDDYYEIPDPEGSSIETENVCWSKEYNAEHKTPLELIQLFQKDLKAQLEKAEAESEGTKEEKSHIKHLKYLIEECEGWTDDESGVYPN